MDRLSEKWDWDPPRDREKRDLPGLADLHVLKVAGPLVRRHDSPASRQNDNRFSQAEALYDLYDLWTCANTLGIFPQIPKLGKHVSRP